MEACLEKFKEGFDLQLARRTGTCEVRNSPSKGVEYFPTILQLLLLQHILYLKSLGLELTTRFTDRLYCAESRTRSRIRSFDPTSRKDRGGLGGSEREKERESERRECERVGEIEEIERSNILELATV